MSRVRRLSIRGIRNFPDTEEATITLSRPLTLIVGQNGVGKTTIIECLRYVTTGEFPPGSEKGKSFVHDPMLKKQKSVQVRGCVKAQFVDREGKTLTVTRTVESTRFEKNVKFKSLDNSVSVYNPVTKKDHQITNRCADVDLEVMSALGVSKAILNNVIFCHQDDANWPFNENKQVKDRFDAIFETTNYNKALETVRKLAKTKNQELKLLNAEKKRLAEKVEVVTAKQFSLNEMILRQEEIEKKIDNMKLRLEPIKQRLDEIKVIEEEFRNLKMEEERKKLEYNLAKEQIETLTSRIKDIYEGTDHDLEEEISSYDSTLQKKNGRISSINADLKELSIDEQRLSKILNGHRIKMGTLQQQMKDQEVKINERNKVLNTALSTWKLDGLDDFESEDEIQNFIETIETKTREFERSISAKRMMQDKKEAILEKKVDAARDKRSKMNSELKRSEKEAEEIRNAIRTTRFQIGQADDAGNKLDAVDAKLVEMDRKIKQINSLMKSENIENEITEKSQKLEENEEIYAQLDKEMTVMQDQSAINVKLESLKTDLKAKNKEIDNLKARHENNIRGLIGKNRFPEYNLKETIEEVGKVLSSRLEKLNQEIQSKDYQLMTVETALEHSKKELNSKISDVNLDKERVRTHCKNYRNYEDILLEQQMKVKNLQDKRGMIAHQGIAYKEYMKEFQKSSCCALCERLFEKPSSGQKLLTKLTNGIKNHPELLKQCERELKGEQEKYDTLLSMKTTVEAVVKFEEVGKDQMMKEIKKLEEESRVLKKKIDELKHLKLEPEKKIEMVKNMIPDLALWDHYSEDLMNIHVALDELQEDMSSRGNTTGKTMEEIQTERENLKKIINENRQIIKELRLKFDERKEELRRATEKRTKCLEEQLRIHNEMQQLRQLKDNLEEFLSKEKTLLSSMQNLRQQSMSADGELEDVVRELDEFKSKNREEQENDRKQSKEYEKQWDKLNAIQSQIIQYQSQNIEKQLKTLEKEMEIHQKESNENSEKKKQKEKLLGQIKEDISCQETKKRNLTDNLDLRKAEKSIKILGKSYQAVKLKLENFNYRRISNEQSELIKENQVIEGEINKAAGNKDEVNNNISQLQADLNKRDYKSAQEDYEKISLEAILTQSAIEDLNMYMKVLDLALTEYHEERLQSVNKTMKKLWSMIYYGNDTKSIQIRAEAALTVGETNRRQFNYKLTQIKHGQEMDMRGRCSAGQRVLASIILRLAMAETFCEQCGILALDEPTTNLDEENSCRLADALYKYIAFRSKHQRNFQLIVITHDETFIRKLSELSTEQSTQELYRMDDGLTSVRKLAIDVTADDSISIKKERRSIDRSNAETQDDGETQRSERNNRKRQHSGSSSHVTKKPYNFDDDF